MELKALKKWTMPDNYAGAVWPNYYVFLGQNRDSDCLTRSNFQSALDAIGGEDGDLVIVVREGHWAVGWVEWIGIHQDAEDKLKEADEIACALEDYPVVDDEHLSNLEYEEAQDVWKNCYDTKDRIEYIRKHRSQFEFDSLEDMISCVRGNHFCGYASELLY